jgi:hypothetical protein
MPAVNTALPMALLLAAASGSPLAPTVEPAATAGTAASSLSAAPVVGPAAAAGAGPAATPGVPATTPDQEIAEIVVQAPEARYVAPTRRDRIGRIWAPVYINDKGPFRLVLDTGASRSCVIARVVSDLALTPEPSKTMRLQAVTGSATVQTVKVESLLVGDLLINDTRLPIIPDALGGAEGILGNEGLRDRRVYIDFRHDMISITQSHNREAPPGFKTVPFKLEHGRLLTVNTWVGRVRAKAIIDTGGQSTVGNLALRDELLRHRSKAEEPSVDHIEGVTSDIQEGEGRRIPAIQFGPIDINTYRMTFADMQIFTYWKLTDEPALLIGMDALGLLDTLIIDYRRNELQLKMRGS